MNTQFPFLPPLSLAQWVGGDYNLSPGTQAGLQHLSPGPQSAGTLPARLCFQAVYRWKLVLRRKMAVDFYSEERANAGWLSQKPG